ncbi:hypothetical protein MTR67_022721 [Solanum verrucosum]|uniref:Retrotransposon gag domain-containing protein n=1 Tax=Solanum verrucosum TaxID=315347 RepID=A0AAF0QZG7_SOLVR|nr:hypothetical protein MTR67_022721 [Solanum verrucosum]
MPPRKVVRGRPARRNVDPQDQGVPNAPEVHPMGNVTNTEFQVVINQVGQQRRNRQDVVDTSKICEFLRILKWLSVAEDLKNFVEELQKVFEVMYVVDAERVELAAYKLKGVARVWYVQWKKNGVEGAPIVSWAMFEESFMRHFFPRELREAKDIQEDWQCSLRVIATVKVSSRPSGVSYFYVEECMADPSLIIPIENIGIKDNLSYEEIPIEILHRQVRKWRTKEVTSVKVLWRNHFVEKSTWEAEEDMKNRYPHLFEPR